MDADTEARRPSATGATPIRVRGETAQPMRFYDTLLDALSELGEGVAVMEGESFLYVNPAFPQMLGYDVRDLVRPGFSVRMLFPPEERTKMEERLRQRFSGEKRDDHYETVLLRQDGSRVDVEISVKPLRHSDNSLRFAVLRDVSARKAAETELQRARDDVATSEKLAALGSLVSGVAHEVRTPLVYIQNGAAVLRRRLDRAMDGPIDPKARSEAATALQEIEEGVERVHRLVRDLARYTRLPVNELEPTHLNEVIGDALRLWHATHRGASVTVSAQLTPTALLRLDRSKVQQLLLNLLQNAAEAMPSGGRVVVCTEALPQGARLVVTDDGVGISEDVRARMFEPLFTTKVEGMGLGLSICRRIVELHHGTIACESAVGRGTTFLVTFPA